MLGSRGPSLSNASTHLTGVVFWRGCGLRFLGLHADCGAFKQGTSGFDRTETSRGQVIRVGLRQASQRVLIFLHVLGGLAPLPPAHDGSYRPRGRTLR